MGAKNLPSEHLKPTVHTQFSAIVYDVKLIFECETCETPTPIVLQYSVY
jgi:hypothetical protein